MTVAIADAEMVRRAYGLWDEGGPAAMASFLHEEAEVSDPPDMIDSKTTHGREAFVTHWEERLKDLNIGVTVEELTEFAPERILLLIKITAAGSGTGIAFDEVHAHLIETLDGLVYRVQIYRDLEAARNDAELAPE